MDWIVETVKEPSVLMGLAGAIVAIAGLSMRGVKAKFTDELMIKLDEKFDAHEKVEKAHDDAVASSIESLKAHVGDLRSDMAEVKTDVREIAREIRLIASNNGYGRKHGSPVGAVEEQ